MARARNIKPSFFINEDLIELEPLTRLLFIGLWCLADREGRLEDRPKRVKLSILPADDCNVDCLLQSLHDRGFIIRYEVDGIKYIQIPNFKKHQNPHVKEATSTIPEPNNNIQAPDKHQASTVQEPEEHHASHAESLLLNPESPLPITESPILNPESVVEQKTHDDIPYSEIVEYLNQKAGTSYKTTTPKTKDLINTRFKDKFTYQDFITVIDKKVLEWRGTEWEKFLRPETLFSNKFEGYLNQRTTKPNTGLDNIKELYFELENEGGNTNDEAGYD